MYSGEYPRLSRGRPGFDSLPGSSIYFPVLVEHAIYYITSESSRFYKRTTGRDHEILGSIVVSIPDCPRGRPGFDSLPGSRIYFPVLVEDAIYYITSESSRF